MNKISMATLKKAIMAVEAERAKQPVALRPDSAQRSILDKNRRASEKMVAGFLTQAGLKKFQALQEQRSAEMERIVAKQKTDALRRASRQKDTLHSSIAAQSKALRDLASKGDVFPNPSYSLDKPFLIWTTPLIPLVDSAVVPFGSWAKFDFKTDAYSGTQKVGFYFYWANPYGDYAVINAATFLSATGYMRAHAPWLWANVSQVDAYAQFGLWFGWPKDVASTSYATEPLGKVAASGALGTGPGVDSCSISAGVSLSKTLFAVPPGNDVVFEVVLSLEYYNDSGNIDADFASGDFKIACPVVVLSLLNSVPVVVVES